MIITIDGPAGTGKSTVAKKVAERLHFEYFDTGAMYRALSLLVLEHHIPLSDTKKIEELLSHFTFAIKKISGDPHYFLNDRDVTAEIRTQKVNQVVSAISAIPAVRVAIWKIQRSLALTENAVFEGRDMGSVVFPQAEVKIFLTADDDIRAKRRLDEMIAKSPKEVDGMTREHMLAEIQRRDFLDSTRLVAPLTCPNDAFVIDTSHLNIDQVVDRIVNYCAQKT